MRKLARRAAAVTLGAGVSGTLWFAVEAHRQAGIAVARRRLTEERGWEQERGWSPG